MKPQLSLRRRLQVIAAVALVPAFAIVAVNLATTRSLRLAEVDAYTLRMSEILQHEVIRGLSSAAILLVAAGNAPTVATGDDDCESYLGSFARDLPTVVNIGAADISGTIYCKAGDSEVEDLKDVMTALLPLAKERQLAVGNYAPTPRGATLPIAMAIRDSSGEIIRYMVITVALTELENLIAQRSDFTGNRALVTDSAGTVLLRYPPADDLRAGDVLPLPYSQLATYASAGTIWLSGNGLGHRIAGYQPVTERVPLSFIFELPAAAVMAPINRTLAVNSALALAGAMLAMVIATWSGKKFIQRPVNQLLTVLEQRRTGASDARSGMNPGVSEIEMVGTAIDDLFDELDRRQAERQLLQEQRDLSVRELQHRVKNLLAIIQVIAKQTLSRKSDAPEVVAFEQRIHALIEANAALLSGPAEQENLRVLIGKGIEPFVGVNDRFELDGPQIIVSRKISLTLAMVIHELGTNSGKHGALSHDTGRIQVSWAVEGDEFILRWIEVGVSQSSKPSPPGFGTMMIKRVLEAETRGRVSMDFTPDGFRFGLTAPVELIAASNWCTELA